MVSNYVGNDLACRARRWSKKEGRFIEIERPTMVVEYNSHMGGVDLCDMLLSLYRIHHRSTKYYMHIIFYCIGVAVVNGWLLSMVGCCIDGTWVRKMYQLKISFLC